MYLTGALALFLGLTGTVQATCSSLTIDDFSRSSPSGLNSLRQWASHDNSMAKISISSEILSFTPKKDGSSYFYETVGCINATKQDYNAISLSIKGPKDATMLLEIQTKSDCTDSKFDREWVQVTGLTGSTKTLSISLSSFTGANLGAISAFGWSTFSQSSEFQFSNLQLTCGDAPNPPASTAPITTTGGLLPTSELLSTMTQASISFIPQFPSGSSSTGSSFLTLIRSKSSSTRTVSITQTQSSIGTSTPTSSPSSSVTKVTTPSLSSSQSSTSLLPSRTFGISSTTSPAALSSFSSSSNLPFTTRSNLWSTSGSSTAQALPSSSSCSNLLIDDWASQSRLRFLFYNAMLQPSSDDQTMADITVASGNRVKLTPKGTNSYFYSKTACTNTQVQGYGGISMRIKAPRGTAFTVQMASSTTCGGQDTNFGVQSTDDLGWKFDGTEKLYSLDFSSYNAIDKTKVSSILFSGLTGAITLGPMAFHCGNKPSEYVVKAQQSPTDPTSTVPAPSGTSGAKVVDRFASKDSNALGFWHGADVETALTWGNNRVTIKAPDADFSFYTQLSASCADMTSYDGSYLHVAYSGTNKFSIALQQHNQQCDDSIAPFPETWDSLEAARYSTGNDIYIPMSHFNIERKRVIGVAFKGFYTSEAVTLTKVEIVSSVPTNVHIPAKLPSGNLIFACKRENSIAFAIDDGSPEYAQEVMEVIRSENIKVTFFTVGAPLRDSSTNLSTIYRDMMAQGHQIALHSYTHPRMESLPNDQAIAWEYDQDIAAVADMFGGLSTKYFRPPFGNEGARMRQQLVTSTGNKDSYIVNWNIDVEDWLWAESTTPEKQLEAFQRDLDKGGNLVVMHYLYPTTVKYLRHFIQMAKKTGKHLMRVDQCMMDPEAPPL